VISRISASWAELTRLAVFALFAGRLMQALGSACIWVIGFATIADHVPASDLGKVYGFVTIAISAGTTGGPLVAGVLFDLGGYWTAWSSVLVVIVLDVILRILMLEKRQQDVVQAKAGTDTERDALIPPSSISDHYSQQHAVEEKTGLRFYLCLCCNGRFLGGVVSYFCFAVLTSSFDTTLPLHVRDTFHWTSLPAGLLFAAFQGPAVFLAVPVGWLKDKVGTRHPTSTGFLLLVPVLWMIGVPGDERFPWANQGGLGPIVYSLAILSAGIVICLLNGVGMMEATRKFSPQSALTPP
jgi:MFS family permease